MNNLNVAFIFHTQTYRIHGYEVLDADKEPSTRSGDGLEISQTFTIPDDAPVLNDPRQFQMTEDLTSVEAVPAETLEAELSHAERVAASHDALAYLASTDWYVSRLAETGTAIPEAVATNRAIAREKVLPEHKET